MKKKNLQPLLNGRSKWCTENYGAHSLTARKLVLLGAHHLIYGDPNWVRIPNCYWNRLWDGLGVGELCLRARGAGGWQREHLGGPLASPKHAHSPLEPLGRQQAQHVLLRPRGMNGTRKDTALEGLKRKLMFLKFWSIKVILHSATEAMGQWKQITVHSPNRKIKTQEAAECCRHWPWLHNLANLCCLWGCTAVSEKTNLLLQKLLFYIIFLSFPFFPQTLAFVSKEKPKSIFHIQNANSCSLLKLFQLGTIANKWICECWRNSRAKPSEMGRSEKYWIFPMVGDRPK